MGKRGPQPTPTALKILRGNPGKRRLNADEPAPTGSLPACPDHLSGRARDAWESFAPRLRDSGVGTDLDSAALALLCEACARYAEAAENVAKYGAVWISKGAEGEPPVGKISPYARIMDKERDFIKRMMASFGMTPSDRTNVKTDRPKSIGIIKRNRGA